MTATTISTGAPTFGRMRPLNIMRDLPAVADLIELCFSATLDADGRSFIDQMRRNGRDSMFLSWAPRVIETVSLPLSGFVWENNGRVVGNVSLIPFSSRGKKIFLIANVATHPDFRRQGIARQLTQAALSRAREKRARSVWLHVRDDNPGAIQLYKDLGFIERARRTTWNLPAGITTMKGLQPHEYQIANRSPRDWLLQSSWLEQAYPRELAWYHSQGWDVFKPGLLNALYCLMADFNIRQWSAKRQGALLGVLGCLRTVGRPDQLWAALPPHADEDVLTALLMHCQHAFVQTRGLTLEYPAGPLDNAFRTAGFTPQRTLAWMQASGAATFQRD